MIWMILAALLCADPFWQTKPALEWTDAELSQFLADSPWAQMAAQPGKAQVGKNAGQGQPVQIYLATARPVVKALAERGRRMELRRPGITKALAEDPLSEERAAWFADYRAAYIIVAARVGNNDAFSSGEETRRMERESVMESGHIQVKVSATFPPTQTDPHLYLAFLREPVAASDKDLSFALYLPGVPGPYRTVTFKMKDMMLDGKPEM
ncbi:MAG TPA: hypothetical protein VL127_13925 [Bryobacteraceae bacterium]|jgi:hypothetical protein|nr:hypothetical protein [Bryobacteraceae bacterium]